MRAVDTNVLVRLVTRDDAKQTAAAERFVKAGGAWISHLVLAEMAWVLDSVYQLAPASIATAIEMLIAHENLTIENPDIVRGAIEQFRGRPRLGFSDCLVVEIARRAGHLPLGTFDRELAKVGGVERL
jgi:predicted nucleic-acid-binding protein